jgi:hypothetical protein
MLNRNFARSDHMDDITWRNNTGEWDHVDQHIQALEKLRVKHNQIFKKIVFAQRDDKQDIAQSHASELVTIRAEINAHLNAEFGR